jgi:hypothetical protein
MEEANCIEDVNVGTGADTDDAVLEGPNGIRRPVGGAGDAIGAKVDNGDDGNDAERRSDAKALAASVRTGVGGTAGTAPAAGGTTLANTGESGITRLGGRMAEDGNEVSGLSSLDALVGRAGDVVDGGSAAGDRHRGRSAPWTVRAVWRGVCCRETLEAGSALTRTVWASVGGLAGGAGPLGKGEV